MINRRDTFYLLPLKKKSMNRSAIVLILVLIAVIALFKFCNNKPDKAADDKQLPLSIAQNSDAFNKSFSRLLNSYYSLKDAFVASDTVKINATAKDLLVSADSLRLKDIKGDSTGAISETANSFATTIGSSATAIQGEKDLEGKRRELNVITDALWSLTRTVKYDGQKVYYEFCSMALKNQGAYWLSNSREIHNPYFGDKMPACGEVADSVDYSKR